MKCKMRLLSTISLIVATLLCIQINVSAANIDYTGTGYISILMRAPDTKEPVPGAIFELFYVGAIDETSSELAFFPAGEFVNSGVSFSDMTASKSAETSKILKLYALANNISGTVKPTGSDGKVRFLSLKLGLYLVVPKNAYYDTPFENLVPFLVSVPITVNQGISWNYGVNVYPKAKTASIEDPGTPLSSSEKSTAKPQTTPQTTPSREESTIKSETTNSPSEESITTPEKLPQTGVLNWPIPVLSVAGLLLFSFGWADIYVKRKKRVNKRGIIAMIIGAVLILGALSLILYNAWDERRALASVESLLPQIEQIIESNDNSPSEHQLAGVHTLTIDGNEYIGIVEISSIGIRLPVLSSWSYPLLKISPCKYSGDIMTGGFVIAGHNYTKHFGRLEKLIPGDEISFIDIEGNVYKYEVEQVKTLEKTQVEEMNNSKWDLTLFTCDYRGRLRITVRCTLTGG